VVNIYLGQDLEQELATEGVFNQQKVRDLLGSLLPVLDFLHSQAIPVIYRDIKPANIIRRSSNGNLVLDNLKVVRGGSASDSPVFSRSSCRSKALQHHISPFLGFRVACDESNGVKLISSIRRSSDSLG
jgi:serine/threonine protein kinase